MASIGTLAVNIVARTEKFAAGMKKSTGLLGKFSTGISRASRLVAGFGAVAGTAAMAMTTRFVKSNLAAIDATAKLSDRINVTTEALTGLRHAGEIYGASNSIVDKSLEIFVRRLGEARQGIGEAKRLLDSMGLSAGKLAGMRTDKAIAIIADKFQEYSTAAEKAAAANALFGRGGSQLINLLQAGGDEVRRLTQEASFLGITFSRDMAAKVEEANDAVTRMNKAFGAMFVQLTIDLAPAIERTANAMTAWLTDSKVKGDLASSSLGGISDAMWLVQKAGAAIEVVFRTIRSALSATISFAMRGINKVIAAANSIPGIDLDSAETITDSMARSLDAAANADIAKGNAASNRFWNGSPVAANPTKPPRPVPSQLPSAGAIDVNAGKKALNRWLNNVLGAHSGHTAALQLGQQARTLGGYLGGLSNSMAARSAASGGSIIGGARSSLTLARAGSAESYRQRIAIERQSQSPTAKIARKQLKKQEEGNTLLGDILAAVSGDMPANIAGG